MARKSSAVTHVTRGDVLDDLGFSRSEATALKFKADLLDAIRGEIERRSYTQRQLVDILDEHQPTVSNLMRGRINQVKYRETAALLGPPGDGGKTEGAAGSQGCGCGLEACACLAAPTDLLPRLHPAQRRQHIFLPHDQAGGVQRRV